MTISPNARRQLGTALVKAAPAKEIADTIHALPTVTTIDEVLTLTNAVKKDLSTAVPAGAVITSIAVNLQTAVTGDASGDDLLAKIGVGITGNVAKYGNVATLTKNSKLTKIPSHAVLGSAETIGVYALKTDGTSAATEKFTAGGKVRVRITYDTPYTLPNA
jgi:hypothetical protein